MKRTQGGTGFISGSGEVLGGSEMAIAPHPLAQFDAEGFANKVAEHIDRLVLNPKVDRETILVEMVEVETTFPGCSFHVFFDEDRVVLRGPGAQGRCYSVAIPVWQMLMEKTAAMYGSEEERRGAKEASNSVSERLP